jgi:pyruvate/2-oxoglutarate dehydrogenase complex dihydrolipoamide acyltransferase (E2) component
LAAQKIYIKLSVNDFTIKAAALALRKVPAATEAVIRQYTDIDISVAVATANGLITPIVRKADVKTLVQISAEMKGMAQRARDGRLRPEKFQGGIDPAVTSIKRNDVLFSQQTLLDELLAHDVTRKRGRRMCGVIRRVL